MIWKVIKWNDRYMVSEAGEVKAVCYERTLGHSRFTVQEKTLKPRMSNSGYQYVDFGRDGGRYYIHRLVAQHFIENPKGKRTVNHKNGNKLDNRADNLEWATYSENHKHAYDNGLHIPACPRKGKFGKDNPTAKKIIQYDMDGNKVAEWYGAYEVNRQTGYSAGDINACCIGRRKSAYGYKWVRA